MSQIADQSYLKKQYQDASNLNDRIQIHVRFSTNRYSWHRWVFDQIELPEHAPVLELGCGPGRLWAENLERIPAGWQITLTDFSPGMLEEARRNLAGARPFAFEVADAQAIPFGDATFDGVIANHMLYHVPDLPRVLAEIRRVLKPDGQFYATTIGETHLRELHDLAARFDPALVGWGGSLAHRFRLENGTAQLAPFFGHVVLRRYDDALVVTAAEPIVAFVASSDPCGLLKGFIYVNSH
jgi:ubiquinone/menaquinone biosynthesis C-methylase UbiE